MKDAKEIVDKKYFTKIFSYFWIAVRNYKWLFVGTFVFYGVGRILSGVLVPVYYQRIIDVISQTSDRMLASEALFQTFFMLIGVILVYNILYRVGDFVMTYFQIRTLKDLSDFAFKKLQKHSYKFFTDTFAGSLVAKHRRFVRSFEKIHDHVIFSFWLAFLQLVGSFVVLFSNNLFLGYFFTGWTVLYICLTFYLGKRNMNYATDAASKDSLVTARLADSISNILNIKVFASSEREQEEFESVTEEQRKAGQRLWNFYNILFAVQGTMMMILEIGGMYMAIKFWLSGSISSGTVVLVQIYIGIIFSILWNLGKSITSFIAAASDAVEMIEVFETEPDVKDVSEPESFKVKKGEIELSNVNFSYGDEKVLDDFSLKIGATQKVGLVGESGAGKTTITKLILRFADVASGKILIDGQDISRVSQDDVRRSISYVPQEPLLFHRSLKENIAYGKPGASMEEIVEVAKRARAHNFISSFSKGYETLVGERGVKLSGGERQRVAIARAMLENAPIVVLDEATSSLDSLSEKAIQEAFEELLKSKTAIVIAHRLSTVRKMDRIIVLDKGRIVEDGTHEELLSQKSFYFKLWQHQQGGFID